MIHAAIDDWTMSYGPRGGGAGGSLFLRHDVVIDSDGVKTPVLATAWTPTPAEIWRICHGANIHVLLAGNDATEHEHPPITVTVGELPEGGVMPMNISAPKDAPTWEAKLPTPYDNNTPPPPPPDHRDEGREPA